MSSYKKLLEIKNSCRLDYFVMACSYFFDIGYSQAKDIPEKAIERAEGNGFMTKECVQWIMKTAKQIADVVEGPIDLVQFCAAEDIFETQWYANKLSRTTLEHMLNHRFSLEDRYIEKDPLVFCDRYDCSPDELEMVYGRELNIPEEEVD